MSSNAVSGSPAAAPSWPPSTRSMLARAFWCATMRTASGNSPLPPAWSPCAWVLMMVVTGNSVTRATVSTIVWPQPDDFVSISTTPPLASSTSASEWPPPSMRM